MAARNSLFCFVFPNFIDPFSSTVATERSFILRSVSKRDKHLMSSVRSIEYIRFYLPRAHHSFACVHFQSFTSPSIPSHFAFICDCGKCAATENEQKIESNLIRCERRRLQFQKCECRQQRHIREISQKIQLFRVFAEFKSIRMMMCGPQKRFRSMVRMRKIESVATLSICICAANKMAATNGNNNSLRVNSFFMCVV